MIAQQHADDASLPPLTPEQLETIIPRGPYVVVLRESASEREPAQIEHWGRSFVLSRLANDGAFDASSISANPDFTVVTRALNGERIFVKTSPA